MGVALVPIGAASAVSRGVKQVRLSSLLKRCQTSSSLCQEVSNKLPPDPSVIIITILAARRRLIGSGVLLDFLGFPRFFVIFWSRVIFGKTKIALVITPRLDGSIRAHRKPRTCFYKTQVDFEFRPSQPVALPTLRKPTFCFAKIDLIFVPRPIRQVENDRKFII